jgi:D-proline reductase (dithiol) PrdB
LTRFPFYPPEMRRLYEAYAAEYSFEAPASVPWMPLRRDLRDCKVALLTTAGVRPKASPPLGDAEIRRVNVSDLSGELAFDLGDLDCADARRDLNVLLPVDPTIDLVEKRRLRELDEEIMSMDGAVDDPSAVERAALAAGERLRGRGVDVVVLVAAGCRCNQTTGLAARAFERAGLTTIALMTVREVAAALRLPRAAFVNFPFGRPLGPAFVSPLHRQIVGDLFESVRRLDRPGRIVDLPYLWPAV